MKSYGFLGPEIHRGWVLWATRNPYEFILFLSGSDTIWLYIVSGPGDKSKIRLVSYQMALWVQNGFWTALKQYNFVWLSGPGDKSKIGLVSYHKSLWTQMAFKRLWNNMNLYVSAPGNRSKMGPASYHTPYVCLRRLRSFETVWIRMVVWPRN